jgi:class 3 adenylate cyclase
MPEHPVLAQVSAALDRAGYWAMVVDERWRLVYVTDEARRAVGAGERGSFAIGASIFGAEQIAASAEYRLGSTSIEDHRAHFLHIGGLILSDMDDDRERLQEAVDPAFHDLIDELKPDGSAALVRVRQMTGVTGPVRMVEVSLRIRDDAGRVAGTVILFKPDVGMFTIGMLTIEGDSGHFERMQLVARAGRRPAAILFADLESSTPLAKRLSTANYFSFSRHLLRATDQSVVDAGGLVGRHVGDGIAAFFLAETAGSESAAARACLTAALRLNDAVRAVAERHDLDPVDVSLRFGLHWGATPFIGNITTSGRSEVTALGDEVNEAARIEACATGGRALASKALIERLDSDDADAVGIDLDRATYKQLADIRTATDKARRDAPSIAVCDILHLAQ